MERIGEGLRRRGKLQLQQVEHIVTLQQQGDTRLFGEIAVDLDYIVVSDLLYYLRDSRHGEHEVV